MKLLFGILLLFISTHVISVANPDDSTQTNNIFKNGDIRIFYSGNQNNVYKEIDLHFNSPKCGIESIDWKSFRVYLQDITSDSVYNLAKVISKTNNEVNCNTLKSDGNDLFALLYRIEGHYVPRVILNRMELTSLLKNIENNFDYKNLESESRQIIIRLYLQLQLN
jgi:hypothetical protein